MLYKSLGLFSVLALLLSAQVAQASSSSSALFELQEVPHLSNTHSTLIAAKCGSGACGSTSKSDSAKAHACGAKNKKGKHSTQCGSKQKKGDHPQQCGSKQKEQQCGSQSKKETN
ncbi:MAG: hypothetical protein ACKO37_04310 [Vampirovibrionales bacterium]